ncbi:MAG: hypothetical protein WC299_03700 [Kiritimatiellia bacterium]
MKTTAALLAGALLFPAISLADTICLKDGTVMKCKVCIFSNDVYFLEQNAGWENQIPAGKIKSIEFDSDTRRRILQPMRQNDAGREAPAPRPIKEPADCDWFKTAMDSKPVTMKMSAISSSRISMAGKLVKFVFQARIDMRQVNENVFSARVVDDGWDSVLTVSFGKDGLDFMERVADRQRRYEQNISTKYTCYGIVMDDGMKMNLSHNSYMIGDVFLVGRTTKKTMGGESSISW